MKILFLPRILKFVIMSHHGDEFFCPISELRVHGVHILQRLKEQIESDQHEVVHVEKVLFKGKQDVPLRAPPRMPDSFIIPDDHLSKNDTIKIILQENANDEDPHVIPSGSSDVKSIPSTDSSPSSLPPPSKLNISPTPAKGTSTGEALVNVRNDTAILENHHSSPIPPSPQSSNTHLATIVQQLSAISTAL